MGWKIKDWADFEIPIDKRCANKVKSGLDFIKVTVNLRNENLLDLLEDRIGKIAFALWLLILEIWAEQKHERRDGGVIWYQERPVTHNDLLKKLPGKWTAKEVGLCVDKLLQIGWLEPFQEDSMNLHRKYIENPALDIERDIDIEKEIEIENIPSFIDLSWIEPKVEYVKLTQKQYDKLCCKWSKPIVDCKVADLDDWLCHNPKKRQGRDCDKTINTWLRKEQNVSPKPSVILAKAAEKHKPPPHIVAEIRTILEVFNRWQPTESGLGYWFYNMRDLTPKQAAAVRDSICAKSGIEPDRGLLKELRKDLKRYG